MGGGGKGGGEQAAPQQANPFMSTLLNLWAQQYMGAQGGGGLRTQMAGGGGGTFGSNLAGSFMSGLGAYRPSGGSATNLNAELQFMNALAGSQAP